MTRLVLFIFLLLLAGCQGSGGESDGGLEPLGLPELQPVALGEGEQLQVVATTSIIGDVAAQVGGEAIALKALMQPGQDEHSYRPAPSDLIELASADVILVNGWQLEEGLLRDLERAAEGVPLVPVSANIEPLPGGAHEEEEDEDVHGVADPHVWLDPHLVRVWVENIRTVLNDLDPAREATYEANAAAYLAQLDELIAYSEEKLAVVPPKQRRLVTNHEALAYFARAFDFEIVGAVIPSTSTVSEPSARALAALVDRMEATGVCTIFVDSGANPGLAEATAAELRSCPRVAVLPLYTGALGAPGSGAESYLGMMRANVDTIVAGLAQ